jgi:hypothetical protein
VRVARVHGALRAACACFALLHSSEQMKREGKAKEIKGAARQAGNR